MTLPGLHSVQKLRPNSIYSLLRDIYFVYSCRIVLSLAMIAYFQLKETFSRCVYPEKLKIHLLQDNSPGATWG